jgi:hypothetical protein
MSLLHSKNATHRANLLSAEQARQAATPPGTSAAATKTADITFYRSALASAKANNCSPEPFVTALLSLGTGGA